MSRKDTQESRRRAALVATVTAGVVLAAANPFSWSVWSGRVWLDSTVTPILHPYAGHAVTAGSSRATES